MSVCVRVYIFLCFTTHSFLGHFIPYIYSFLSVFTVNLNKDFNCYFLNLNFYFVLILILILFIGFN